MDLFVVVATKGRPQVVDRLLDSLLIQTVVPRRVVVVGTEQADIAAACHHPGVQRGIVEAHISDRAGLCAQRNFGIDIVQQTRSRAGDASPFAIVFLDDDFRLAATWLQECRQAFLDHPELVGVTGCVLADGVNGPAVSEEDAIEYIDGKLPPRGHWAVGWDSREIDSLYGCNMAFRDVVVSTYRFDDNLPLYGWQEDRDYSVRASGLGRLMYIGRCRGVHLGVKSGRVSGRRFGYSQIANPWYLSRKGTMSARTSLRFVSRHLAVNIARSLFPKGDVDYPGRLTGNVLAILDVVRGRSDPKRAASMR